MGTPLALLAVVLCALPLVAQSTPRRVVAPCALTSAAVTLSGKDSETQGRQYAIRVTNNSTHTIAIPRSPIFGWRVEIQERKVWRLKAEGGPVRRINSNDEHIAVVGNPAPTPLVEILPAQFEDFYTFLPEAEKALQPQDQPSTLKLTLYWAAPAELTQNNRAVPLCALQPEWVVSVQKDSAGDAIGLVPVPVVSSPH